MKAVGALALVLVTLLAFLTAYVLVRSGPDPLTVLSLIVLVVLAVGISGALRPPDRRR
jgi:hypothetical protein